MGLKDFFNRDFCNACRDTLLSEPSEPERVHKTGLSISLAPGAFLNCGEEMFFYKIYAIFWNQVTPLLQGLLYQQPHGGAFCDRVPKSPPQYVLGFMPQCELWSVYCSHVSISHALSTTHSVPPSPPLLWTHILQAGSPAHYLGNSKI